METKRGDVKAEELSMGNGKEAGKNKIKGK